MANDEPKSQINDDKLVCLELAIEALEQNEPTFGRDESKAELVVNTAKTFYNYLTK